MVDDLVAERGARDRGAGEQVPRVAQGGRQGWMVLYALPTKAGSSSSPSEMPCNPAAMIALSAMYGLRSEPPARFSKRRPAPCPTMRSAQVRLSLAQAIVVGAKEPSANRL
jgi:hypothetical protein